MMRAGINDIVVTKNMCEYVLVSQYRSERESSYKMRLIREEEH